MSDSELDIALPEGGFQPSAAAEAVRAAGLADAVARRERGPFGPTARGLATLEAIAAAVDRGLYARSALAGRIRADLSPAPTQAEAAGWGWPALTIAQTTLLSAFQVAVTADAARDGLADIAPAPTVSGALELDGLDALLAEGDGARLATRVLSLAARFIGQRGGEDAAATGLSAFLELLRRGVVTLTETGASAPLVQRLEGLPVTAFGRRYHGLASTPGAADSEDAAGLLPIAPEHIVGNDDYVAAGLRLARDVAGYDLARGRNPKRINPVLFGLGRPGCGKTVTAHAVGNYFLDYCRARGVPAKFVVVRRSDWASSYQNASASNLVRIFKEQVYGFDGVCGVYWGDIDTAFASRESSGLRMEEKNNLGAVFGIFDGTLLPKDGKWFMICDANTMNMDEATVSRIAQNPFTVTGPVTAEDYIRLMRDIMLRDVAAFVPQAPEAWERLGAKLVAAGLSGRAVDAICNNVRGTIQDFEYPQAYFELQGEARDALVATLARPVGEALIADLIDRRVAFAADAKARGEKEQFDREVAQLVRQLNAGRAAAERAVGLTGGTGDDGRAAP